MTMMMMMMMMKTILILNQVRSAEILSSHS